MKKKCPPVSDPIREEIISLLPPRPNVPGSKSELSGEMIARGSGVSLGTVYTYLRPGGSTGTKSALKILAFVRSWAARRQAETRRSAAGGETA